MERDKMHNKKDTDAEQVVGQTWYNKVGVAEIWRWIKAFTAGGGLPAKVIEVTGGATYEAVAGDWITVDATAGDSIVTVPSSIENKGLEINISKIDATANIVTINAVDLIDGTTPQVLTVQWDNASIVSMGTYWKVK